ncbi:hypothetical protein HII31_07117, partial [Pseudocercospora fuligena]
MAMSIESRESLTPTIVSTCRQIDQEATPILYSQNIISINRDIFVKLLPMFLHQIGPSRAQYLQHISLYGVANKYSIDHEALEGLKGLRKVSIWIHQKYVSITYEIEMLAEGLLPVVKLLLSNRCEDGGFDGSAREVLSISVITEPSRKKAYCSRIPENDI